MNFPFLKIALKHNETCIDLLNNWKTTELHNPKLFLIEEEGYKLVRSILEKIKNIGQY